MIERYEIKEIAATWSDQNKFEKYLEYEIALISALENHDICEAGTADRIRKKVKVSPTRISEIEQQVRHDVIAFCSSITEQLTEHEARYFHFGVTSSDVIDSSINMLIDESLRTILEDYKRLLKNLFSFCEQTKTTLTMGRSHGINAEPMSLGQKFLGHYCELYRRFNELNEYKEKEITVQCSGAVGNYTVIKPEIEQTVSKILGYTTEPVSTQIIPRDRYIKLMGILSSFASGLDRFCIELRHLQHSNIAEVSEGFGDKQKGSSTMPHKKNPISGENLSGISRLIKSYYQVALENNNLWHERDISHSSSERFILPDSLGLTCYALRRLNKTIKGLVVHHKQIEHNFPSNRNYLSSFALHSLLTSLPNRREELYEIVQQAAFNAQKENVPFSESLEKQLVLKNINNPEKVLNELNKKDPQVFALYTDDVFERVARQYPTL